MTLAIAPAAVKTAAAAVRSARKPARVPGVTYREGRKVVGAVQRFKRRSAELMECTSAGWDMQKPAQAAARSAYLLAANELASAIASTERQAVMVDGILYVKPYEDDSKGVEPVIVIRPEHMAFVR